MKIKRLLIKIAKNKRLTRIRSFIQEHFPVVYYWTQNAIYSKFKGKYLDIPISKSVMLRVWTDSCDDSRGIGRVTRLMVEKLKKIAYEKKVIGRSINLYPSIFFCPDNIEKDSVLILHDVIPLIYPDGFAKSLVLRWRRDYIKLIHKFDLILTMSETAKNDIQRETKVPPDMIKVIQWPITPIVANGDRDAINIDLNYEYILFVGSTDPHKNLQVIFQALEKSSSMSSLRFVLIGDSSQIKNKIPQSIQDRVLMLGVVSDEYLSYAYDHALCVVYPSLYEGFGLPPFEAALKKKPVIVSKIKIFQEFWTSKEVYFADPTNYSSWVEAINKVRDNPTDKIDAAYEKALERTKIDLAEEIRNVVDEFAVDKIRKERKE